METERANRRVAWYFFAAMPVFGFVLDFGLLLGTFLLAGMVVPERLGDVAGSPVRFAAWIALFSTALTYGYMLVRRRRLVADALFRGVLQEQPKQTLWQRAVGKAGDMVRSATAALIVVGWVADPGGASWWVLAGLAAVGPAVITAVVGAPLRWWVRRWRRGARLSG